MPAGLTLADANWTANGSTATFNQLLNITAGQSQTITIDFTVDAFFEGSLINFAEVSDARDEDGDAADDIDSTPDVIDNNDTSVDDVVDNTGGDEDDHDPAEILVERFDLALIKLFNPAQSQLPLLQNRLVTFELQIANQGSVCLLYTSPSPRDATLSRMPSSA